HRQTRFLGLDTPLRRWSRSSKWWKSKRPQPQVGDRVPARQPANNQVAACRRSAAQERKRLWRAKPPADDCGSLQAEFDFAHTERADPRTIEPCHEDPPKSSRRRRSPQNQSQSDADTTV